MANKALKGLTIEIGADTSGLLDALKDVEKKGSDLSKELGQINKLLKLDPDNVELLAQKQKVLSDAIGNTEKKLGTLREAEKQAQEQFKKGEISEQQYRALQREIIATESKLDKYKAAIGQAVKAENQLADGADKVTKELDEQADKTRDADRAAEDLDDSSNDLAAGGLAAIAAAAAAAVTAIVALAEESRAYRNEMSKLNTAFEANGHSADTATKTYEALQSVIGETEQAVEAANHLAALCDTEEELAEWTDILTGVYGRFGVSLQPEALAEAANETARVGTVTGAFADALNWAAKEGETFGIKMKAATEENEEWNKSVEDAASAEDYFNLALQECGSEQERQQLITKTLSEIYGDAAETFRETNAEVIRSNQATEKWNQATAKIGKTVEPVVTDFKELGVVLLEDVSEPLEDTADYIRKDVIPAIKSVSSWVKSNGPVIKGTVVTVTSALVAYKVATAAAAVAQNGLKGAIMETTVAQKALAIVQSATPWGLALTAVAALTAGLVAYVAATKDAKKPVDTLTKEERELCDAAEKTAEAFKEQKKATDEARKSITAQMDYVEDLADELQTLADESGKVKESDQERANFIIHELNEALGTEYQMVDGVIQKYKDLKSSIDEVIKSKKANALLEAVNDDYIAAVQAEGAALDDLNLKERDYQTQLDITNQKESAYNKARKEYFEAMASGAGASAMVLREAMFDAQIAYEEEKEILNGKKTAYDESAANYAGYYSTISNYEEAQTAILSGNYDTAVDLLAKKGGAYSNFAGEVDDATAKVLSTLQQEAIQAGLKAELTKTNFENGVSGYTEDMVKEADKNYQKALSEFETAYADAQSVGEDVGDGFSGGMENKRPSLLAKARSLVSGVIKAMRKEAESKSPAQKTIDFGEDVGEGAEIGIENKTPDVKRAATNQAAAVLDAYRSQEVTAQHALRGVAERQAESQASVQMAAASSNGPLLEKILSAIEKGQIITLDGDALVGATATKMDSALGRRRALASRGAL